MNHDSLISLIFFKDDVLKNNYYKKFYNHPLKYKDKYPNLQYYLDNRYNDSDSLLETLYRIYYKIEIKPKCKTCGKPLIFYNTSKKQREKFIENKCFQTYCSISCEMQDKTIIEKHNKSCLEKYGSVNNTKKQQQTCLTKYGSNTVLKVDSVKEKIKETNIKKYGVEYPAQNSFIKEKTKQTCLKRYGVNSTLNLEKCRLNNNTKESKYKEYLTKEKNNSFKKSEKEEICYKLLKEKYPDIIRQYRSEIYPFNCDFYIPNLNLYIEYQGSDLHGFHPFDETNKNDILRLNDLQERSKKLKEQDKRVKNRYDYSIYTWTDLDIRKRNIAKQNNLNWLEFFSIQELKDWLGKQ